MPSRIRGAHVLITGAGSGIGRLMALGAARRGAHRVLVWDLSDQAARQVRDEIRALGVQAESFCVDVTDAVAVNNTARQTGRVDILINSAGVVTGKRLLDATQDEIERTFRVNTLALYWVTKAFLAGMIERHRGTVVVISSAAGLVGVARQTDYSASKFAAFGFTESLRHELRKDRTGIRTLTVCPYYIDTGMFAGVQTKWPKLLPILDPQQSSDRILDAIDRGQTVLVMPPLVRLLPIMRMLPTSLFDRLTDLFGVNNTMDAFTGRAGR